MIVVGSGTGTLNALHKRPKAKSLAASIFNQME